MDIHRSRFVPYPVRAITSVAFSRSNNEGLVPGQPQPALKLALGRENGDIEIWDPSQGIWVQEVVFPGDGKSIDGLAWTRDPDETDLEGRINLGQQRLFSIASSPTVTEWDLESGQPKRRATGNFSEVWCFAAQPRLDGKLSRSGEDAPTQDIVAGCGDGTVVLLSTADNDLQFKRFLARVGGHKAKCVSIGYQNRRRVLAGFTDGMIRIFDSQTATTVRTMSLGASIPGAPKEAVVWQVKALPNGDIVSADSNGEVVFWDGRSYSLSQRIKGHDSECLDVVTSADGKTIFSGSMDGRIALYRQSTNPNGRQSWAKVQHRKTHGGQVRTMSAFDSKSLSVVVSGGDDLAPIVTPLREFGKEKIRALPAMPQHAPIVSARHARLFASWWDTSISIWRVARKPTIQLSTDPQPPRKLVAKITLSTRDTIRSVSFSEDGRTIAASTSSEVRIFQLRRRLDTDALGIRKIALPSSVSEIGARLVKFSPDGKWLALVTPDNEIQLLRLTAEDDKPKHIRVVDKVAELERRHRKDTVQTGFSRYDLVITHIAFALDSSILVVGDLSGHLDSWVLEGHEDPTAPAVDVSQKDAQDVRSEAPSSDDSNSSDDDDDIYVFYGQHWADNPAGHLLPKLGSSPLVLSFRPSVQNAPAHGLANGNPGIHATRHKSHAHSHELPQGEHYLWVMTAQHQMYEFDVLAGRLSDWSRRNPTSVLPDDFTRLKDRVVDAIWDVKPSHQRLWLYGANWLFMLNMDIDLADPASQRKKRRKSELATTNGKRPKLNSGAGDKKDAADREALPSTLKRFENGAWTDMNIEDPAIKAEDDDVKMEEDADDFDDQLRLRRIKSEEGDEADTTTQESQQQRKWFYVLKYRPILGIVPLEDDARVDEDKPLEVVLVERPLWDVREADER